jgi:hypothetical protein
VLVTANRFQYMADLTSQKTKQPFLPLGVAAAPGPGRQGLIAVAELINSSPKTILLKDLVATISRGST